MGLDSAEAKVLAWVVMLAHRSVLESAAMMATQLGEKSVQWWAKVLVCLWAKSSELQLEQGSEHQSATSMGWLSE